MQSFCVHSFSYFDFIFLFTYESWAGRFRDRMVVRFATTCAISAYHHLSCEFEPCLWQGVLDTTLCEKVCQQQVGGFLRFPPLIKLTVMI